MRKLSKRGLDNTSTNPNLIPLLFDKLSTFLSAFAKVVDLFKTVETHPAFIRQEKSGKSGNRLKGPLDKQMYKCRVNLLGKPNKMLR